MILSSLLQFSGPRNVGHRLFPTRRQSHVFDGSHGLVEPLRYQLEAKQQHGRGLLRGVLCRGSRGGKRSGNLQHWSSE